MIENVEQQLNTKIKYDNVVKTIQEHLVSNFSQEYYFNDNPVINARDYGKIKKSYILMSKIKKWNFPQKDKEVTVRSAIGHLPSLEPLIKEEFSGDNKKFWKYNEYHYTIHPKRHIEANNSNRKKCF